MLIVQSELCQKDVMIAELTREVRNLRSRVRARFLNWSAWHMSTKKEIASLKNEVKSLQTLVKSSEENEERLQGNRNSPQMQLETMEKSLVEKPFPEAKDQPCGNLASSQSVLAPFSSEHEANSVSNNSNVVFERVGNGDEGATSLGFEAEEQIEKHELHRAKSKSKASEQKIECNAFNIRKIAMKKKPKEGELDKRANKIDEIQLDDKETESNENPKTSAPKLDQQNGNGSGNDANLAMDNEEKETNNGMTEELRNEWANNWKELKENEEFADIFTTNEKDVISENFETTPTV
ncbi:unnamed protein product [Caenorhabditis angaria]|uniref:Uncharacterized protein n=1 Tax=Caenorhabditis angaria TaxID=860376 RepID=A0A9P1IE95_9PELO|nr:unnamed protein product [Caenorhabditis angaria]